MTDVFRVKADFGLFVCPRKLKTRDMIKVNTTKNAMNMAAKHPPTRWQNWALAAAVAFLGFVPRSPAQTQTSTGKIEPVRISSESGKKVALYTMQFNKHGQCANLKALWCGTFTNDSFVITEAAELVYLPRFEVRNVRLAELARSVEFLSEGVLTVEVAEGGSSAEGNIWRIGTRSAGEAPVVKTRAVAAPHIFASEERVNNLLGSVDKMELELREYQRVSEAMGKRSLKQDAVRTAVKPLPEQKVFILVGSEAGVAGMESLIQAAEKSASTGIIPNLPKSGQ